MSNIVTRTTGGLKSQHISQANLSKEDGPGYATQMTLGGMTFYRKPGEKLGAFIARAQKGQMSKFVTSAKGMIRITLANGETLTLDEYLGKTRSFANEPSREYGADFNIRVAYRGRMIPLSRYLQLTGNN